MKYQVALLVALLGLASQAFACPNPIRNDAVRQDLNSMETLGEQYYVAGNAIEDAWRRENIATQQGNVVASTVAKGQFMFYRFALKQIKDALVNSEAKLHADIQAALDAPCPADYAGGG
jgi:hypothetical protein